MMIRETYVTAEELGVREPVKVYAENRKSRRAEAALARKGRSNG